MTSFLQRLLLLLHFLLLCTLSHVAAQEEILCTYYLAHQRQALNGEPAGDELLHLCRLSGSNYLLPSDLLSQMPDLVSGSTTLACRNLVFNDATMTVDQVSGKTPVIHVSDTFDNFSVQRASVASKKRNRSVLVVRVVGNKGKQSPSFGKGELTKSMFSPFQYSFAAQYGLCSNGQITFNRAQIFDKDSPQDMGVVNLVLSEDLQGLSFNLAIETLVSQAFAQQFGAISAFDHVLFCLPQAMNNNFVAFAIMNDRLSYFSDPWCGMPSATMHEVGHNLGVRHSGEIGEEEYDDESCLMGNGYRNRQGPRKCFNGQKLWYFDWFPNQKLVVSPHINGPWKGNLAAFVDVDLEKTMPVTLRVGPLYIVLNRAAKHNRDVQEKRDMVTIVNARSATSPSEMLAGLSTTSSAPSRFRTPVQIDGATVPIVVEVCRMYLFSEATNQASYASIEIRTDTQPSTCSSTPAAPPFGQASSCRTAGLSCQRDSDCCGDTTSCLLGQLGQVCKTTNAGVSGAMQGYGRGGGYGGEQMMRRLESEDDNGRKMGSLRRQ